MRPHRGQVFEWTHGVAHPLSGSPQTHPPCLYGNWLTHLPPNQHRGLQGEAGPLWA